MSREAVPLSGRGGSDDRGRGSGRIGSGVAALVNLVLLVLVNGIPGWRAVPFLTEDTQSVLFLVNLSLAAGVLVNVLAASFARRWVRAAGDFLSALFVVLTLARLADVFPFAFPDPSVDWALVVRVAIGFGIAGCVVSMLVQIVVLVRIVIARDLPPGVSRRIPGPGPQDDRSVARSPAPRPEGDRR